ncbi:low molecular weight phosphotyrosine protein phosphatase [Janibacter sp. YIM B02568]|uniref:low molecular weight protein-tyrosine-phosphatase n=1 Tax=Janibacter endophyticus TaxID=2806261 RepID=UPI00194EBF9A|nr:low molecular weight protein-tyrosine-phosphatase [Janibacter endophyticus]MBM6544687.1 low molecular weight phosphotyrosine protein phosphatase [Janibacter endophyticus]
MSAYRICVVCTGNICRSPMGEFILRERLEAAGLGDQVVVDSAGTTAWEEGNPADPRTLDVLRRNGHGTDYSGHRARVFDRAWLPALDLVLAADHGHWSTLRKMARRDEDRAKIRMFRSFDATGLDEAEQAMDDPWYGDDASFDQTYAEVVAAADGVVDFVREELARRG